MNSSDEVSHRVIQYKNFGVSFQDWCSTSKASLNAGSMLGKIFDVKSNPAVPQLEIRVQKAWFPDMTGVLAGMGDSSVFSFPRSSSHANESWYFEIARPKANLEFHVDHARKLLTHEGEAIATKLPEEIVFSWALEASLYKQRLIEGGIDPRISVLFSAMCSF